MRWLQESDSSEQKRQCLSQLLKEELINCCLYLKWKASSYWLLFYYQRAPLTTEIEEIWHLGQHNFLKHNLRTSTWLHFQANTSANCFAGKNNLQPDIHINKGRHLRILKAKLTRYRIKNLCLIFGLIINGIDTNI